jgi:hypothetical protein
MPLLTGLTPDGQEVPVQVKPDGRLVAEGLSGPAGPAGSAFINVIINGDLKINRRGVTIAAAANGAYGPDRWKKVNASNMTQIIEDLNIVPGAKYTLSWKGGTPQVLTAPASGHWTLPNIPITATEIQLELGEVFAPFERRPIGLEQSLCDRYFQRIGIGLAMPVTAGQTYGGTMSFPPMRSIPTASLILPITADNFQPQPNLLDPYSNTTLRWTAVCTNTGFGQCSYYINLASEL